MLIKCCLFDQEILICYRVGILFNFHNIYHTSLLNDVYVCDQLYHRRFLLTLDTIDVLCLVYSNFCGKGIISFRC